MKRKGSEEKRERDLKLPRAMISSSSTASRPSSSSNSRRLRDGISGTLTGADWWNLTEEERIPDPSLPGHPIVFANPAFLKFTRYARPEVLRRSAALFQGPLTSRSFLLQIREAVRAERTAQLFLLNYRKDGSPFWILLRHRASSLVYDLLVRERERIEVCGMWTGVWAGEGGGACIADGVFMEGRRGFSDCGRVGKRRCRVSSRWSHLIELKLHFR
ncbi:hypothetical protein Fmac_029589 [Flemingia macrophylla]|uniref:PAS domain-containing protein n=1 Tax=Flemingia macrophylla TaxID=520843 RepID=A0ABD1LAS6_9FABA